MEIKSFIARWKYRGCERSDSQPFWLNLLREVFGVDSPEDYIRFENPVKLEHKSFIDAYIDATHVMIEQKSRDKDLSEPIRQSDGTMLTPYQQAKRYADELPYSKRPRWIVACNFKEFHVYDMENPHFKPEIILLENLEREYHRLQFLIDENYIKINRELKLSVKAGDIVGKIYDALHNQYINPNSDESLKSLNKLCVRIVFCLYAESAGIFSKHKLFRDYLAKEVSTRRALIELFHVLNTPVELRDPYLENPLSDFPYVNGGLFDGSIEIPNFTPAIKILLLEEASSSFNWSDISPTIFGAVFESTLNPIDRRSGGMHYTSIKNIHKVIDPLFLDDLREELESCNTKAKLRDFQNKLASLKFLDPACGSGNFLTETYLSLRRLENELLKRLSGKQVRIGEFDNPVKVSISQFYGIEINDFAVTVAKTALWIAESQMIAETSEIIHRELDFLPLKTNANIYEGNALQIDWHDVAPNVNYIIGNPPFVGYTSQTKSQKLDLAAIFNNHAIDYVAGWFYKAAKFMQDTAVRCAFVSTNSITQGEHVTNVWKPLYEKFGIHIDFAHRSFQWNSESSRKAMVHVVIIGNSVAPHPKPKFIYDGNQKILAQNINFYLQDSDIVFVEKHRSPICDVPSMYKGSQPTDNGNLIIETDEYEEFIRREPSAKKYIRPMLGAGEFINGKKRYCLWLVDCPPDELRRMPLVMKRVDKVREFRQQSRKTATRKSANNPALFQEIRQPQTNYILVPRVSAENRRYVPIDFVDANVIATDAVFTIPNANIYEFGVLTSIVHNAWMRVVCGRLGTGYRYSATLVYNNFPWCTPTVEQRSKIEFTAQRILEVRAEYLDASLADLYDEGIMPMSLRNTHQANDRAVMQAYGFRDDMSEYEIVAELMKLYNDLTN